MLMITLLAVSSLLLHVEAVDRETKSLMNKFNPNEKDFEFGHRANNMYYLPPAPSEFASIDARVGLITLTQFTFQ